MQTTGWTEKIHFVEKRLYGYVSDFVDCASTLESDGAAVECLKLISAALDARDGVEIVGKVEEYVKRWEELAEELEDLGTIVAKLQKRVQGDVRIFLFLEHPPPSPFFLPSPFCLTSLIVPSSAL
jgi:hypothetical protein